MTVLLRRTGAGLVSVLGLGLALLLCAPGASAHVTASSTSALTQGGYGQITFTVPSESATANTVQVVVQFPRDTPLASARTLPTPGWTATVATATLSTPVTVAGREITTAVDTITWTATAGGIGPTEYQTFSISGGPLPMSDTMTFKAMQTYSDGSQVNWVDVPAPGSTDEPEHPAPSISLAAAGASDGHGSSDGDATDASAESASSHSSDSSGASGVAIAALIVGIVAVLLAGAAVLLARRPRH